MKLSLFSVLISSVLLSSTAMAGLSEAIEAFNAKRYPTAFSEFSYLANAGDVTAMYYLGQMYRDGLGVEKNTERAVQLFEQAEGAHNTEATTTLGRMLLYGDGITQNAELGVEYLKKAAHAGDANALFELGEAYSEGIGVERELTYAFGFYLMGALKGDMRSQHKLGLAYYNGRGTPQDYSEALRWLKRSANQGYVWAQVDLGDIYALNKRLYNPVEAYGWYSIIAAYNTDEVGQAAATQRDALADKLKKGEEMFRAQRRTTEWRPVTGLDSVPESVILKTPTPIIPGFNDPETTQKMLAAGQTLFNDGSRFGITSALVEEALALKDTTALEAAVESAAAGGKIQAYTYYGDVLVSRFNDDKKAAEWYQKGAKAGDAYAQYQLAKMYCEGRGVEPNAATCYGWLMLAEKKADTVLKPSVQNALAAVEAAATPEELAQAKEFVESSQKQTESTKTKNVLPINLF